MTYFYDCYLQNLGVIAPVAKLINKLPGGQKLMGTVMQRMFLKQAKTEHGTVHFIQDNVVDHIDAYWGSKQKWAAIPNKLSACQHYTDWNKQVVLDHGYDESKAPSQLNLTDMQGAAEFRGGKCLSTAMTTGDWRQKLTFECAFGHRFEASAKLVLEGGHWCPICERTSWNYGQRAKVDPFFAQVWTPLHEPTENRVYQKVVTELDV